MIILRAISCALLAASALNAQSQTQATPSPVPPNNPSVYYVPRFFPNEVNQILWDGKPLAGRLVSGGQVLKPADVYSIALSMFRSLAKSRGIPERSITK